MLLAALSGINRCSAYRKPFLPTTISDGSFDADGTVLLCLHQWGAHEHPPLVSPNRSEPGNGLLLFFRVDDFDETLPRARSLVAALAEEPHVNPNTGTKEFALRDPDGYYVMISALSAA